MTIAFSGGLVATGPIKVALLDRAPVWQTSEGSLGSFSELTSINEMLLAIDPNDDTVTYSIFSGSLPGGLSLASNGTISGTADDIVSTTTFNFTVEAIDSSVNNLSSTREFSIEIQNVPSGSEIFNAAGSFTHTVETDVTSIEGKCWGGGAGSGWSSTNVVSKFAGYGGGGGYASSVLTVTPGQSLTIKVGGGGQLATGGKIGGGGGGASDIRFVATRQIIAAGGGGGGTNTNGGKGGPGGGLIGSDGQELSGSRSPGLGGTQSAGGAGGVGTSSGGTGDDGKPGIAFVGGEGADPGNQIFTADGGFNGGGDGKEGGGGGGGLFGGGGGASSFASTSTSGGGGGGSSVGTTNISGSGANAANKGDPDYASSAGQGGQPAAFSGGNSGNSGRAVINWGPGI